MENEYMKIVPSVICALFSVMFFVISVGIVGPSLVSAASTESVILGIIAVIVGIHLTIWFALRARSSYIKATSPSKFGRDV